ncbi:MAG: 2-oxoglutarate dehydrogenase complex dihydrolipoyllysine-residue succinyltransferase [Alphaproteobacteria bacterium]|nr:2-oxoglutarate dehydrogenase complex dihydrolipoyllysine-residue succinyltransferase [Alphaproteobacteria bacterium]
MSIQIQVPVLGESVTEATVAKWFRQPGEPVNADDPLCALETDKVTLEVPAPANGALEQILVQEGETVEVGTILASFVAGAGAAAVKPVAVKVPIAVVAYMAAAPSAAMQDAAPRALAVGESPLAPSVRRIASEFHIDPATVAATGKGGRVTKGDMLAAAARPAQPAPVMPVAPAAQDAREERVRMSRLRKTIAKRLKDAQNTAAMLTTFNEVDMSAVMAMRDQFKDVFFAKHGVRLGFMGFFVKAAIQALREIPAVNAEIDGEDLVYKNYYNIGVAVGTPSGLVVPVVHDADMLGFAGLEKAINDLGVKARDGKLSIADLQGGTFTISNGGVYGSLMSTPILNPPQSGILGMHKIQERPIAVKGQAVVRPMMYLALSYDHRIIDGREAVTFLVRIKECLEDPQRLLLDL